MSPQAKPDRDRDDIDPLRRPEDLEFLEALERAIEATIRLQNTPNVASSHHPAVAPSEPSREPEPSAEPEIDPESGLHSQPPELAPLSTTPAPIRRPMPDRGAEPGQQLRRTHLRMESFPDEQSRREAAVEMLRQRRRPEPDEFMVRPRVRRWDGVAVTSRLMLAVGVAASVGLVIYHFMSSSPQPAEQTASNSAVRTALVGRAPDPQAANKPARRLVLTELSGAANRPVALGVTVEGPPQGAAVMVRGLPSNSRITAGQAAGEGAWQIPAPELNRAAVVPPADYVGTLTLSVDLILADGSITDSDVLRLQWTPTMPDAIAPKPVRTTTIAPDAGSYPPSAAVAAAAPAPAPASPPTPTPVAAPPVQAPAVAAAPPAPAVAALPQVAALPPVAPVPVAPPPPSKPATSEQDAPPPAAAPVRQLGQDELATLVRRAEMFLTNGDISAARLLLRRAAEAGDVRATLALAQTYDPIMLKQLGALGAKEDVAQARLWYQKASELGSAEAVMRLQRLAQERR